MWIMFISSSLLVKRLPYGKVAQNVKQKSRWSSSTGQMEDIGCSSITNPVSAAMITSIVRAVLLAAQNQITAMGYTVYSVTTDGFISNIPEEALKALDLYGLRAKLSESRLFLTDGSDPEIWEIKHIQDDLLNLTTRGNVSLNTGGQPKELPDFLTPETAGDYYKNPVYKLPGVCAHNSTKSGYLSESYDDRLWLITQALTRSRAVDYYDAEWTPFKKLVSGEPFRVRRVCRHVRMDFDMKRKPLKDSVVEVNPIINGERYVIANFTTEPFETPEEFLKYREVKEKVPCLRTLAEWETFFTKLLYHGTNARPRDFELSKLKSVIMGYRNNLISIPYLDNPDISMADKVAWINSFNRGAKPYTVEDWKNARKSNRISSMLPMELLEELVEKMQAASKTFGGHILDNHGEWRLPHDFFARMKKLEDSLAKVLRRVA